VGYPADVEAAGAFVELVLEYRDAVAEVYFPWPGLPSGRASLGRQHGYADWSAQEQLLEHLRAFAEQGIGLDLLLNANCYGGRAVSRHLEREVCSILEYLEQKQTPVRTVTTASPFIARTIKTHFPAVDVRASVNMRLATAEAMSYVMDLFDSFYLCRDVQRRLETVREVAAWCRVHGKGLCLLANSGCLRACPGQTFHDNLVAHDQEVDETVNVEGWNPHVCWRWLREPPRRAAVLQATWIRPEDLAHYPLDEIRAVKLATRMHANPRLVLHAYSRGRHNGNLLDLLEPGFAPLFAPDILDNARFPAGWFDRTSTCDGRCLACGFCQAVLPSILNRPAGA
jgi:hypothetical protein